VININARIKGLEVLLVLQEKPGIWEFVAWKPSSWSYFWSTGFPQQPGHPFDKNNGDRNGIRRSGRPIRKRNPPLVELFEERRNAYLGRGL
jgi:hypothetical protein